MKNENNNKKINQTRRQRGYTFENTIVKKLNDSSNWSAKRLGSPSTALPDVMGINDMYKTVIAIEAKSTLGNLVYIPQDQIERCKDWVNQFGVYDIKIVILAFKFGQTIQKIKDKLVSRKLTYFYKVFPHKTIPPCEVRGDFHGNTWRKIDDGSWVVIEMENFKI